MISNGIRPALMLGAALMLAVWPSGLARAQQPSAAPASIPPAHQAGIDHQAYDVLLQRHVRNGFVDYEAFARAPEFPRYLAALDQVRLDGLSEDERLAFWLNVYNAFTIQLIVSHRETASIRNVNKSLGVLQLKGPWSEPLVRAAGKRLTLDDVFHGILRKQFAEPRIHYAVSCAAMGCAPLRSEAYRGDRLVDQLNDQGRRFFHEAPMRNQIDSSRVRLSPILMAYRSDFGAGRRDLLRAIAPWFDGEQRKRLSAGTYILLEHEFDWTLNSQAQARARGLLPPTM